MDRTHPLGKEARKSAGQGIVESNIHTEVEYHFGIHCYALLVFCRCDAEA